MHLGDGYGTGCPPPGYVVREQIWPTSARDESGLFVMPSVFINVSDVILALQAFNKNPKREEDT